MKSISRRLFIGGISAASTTTVCAQWSLLDSLNQPNSLQQVKEIVLRHFPVPANSDVMFKDFHRALMTSAEQTESPEYFKTLLEKPKALQRLETYVVEQFLTL